MTGGATREDVWKLLNYITDDLRQTQAKLVEVRSMLAAGAMERTERQAVICPKCGADTASEQHLAFHLQNVHGGPPVPLTPIEEAA